MTNSKDKPAKNKSKTAKPDKPEKAEPNLAKTPTPVPAKTKETKPEGFNVVTFIQESKSELAKVVWPSRQQVFSESAAVILMVTFVATTVYFMDRLFIWLNGKVF